MKNLIYLLIFLLTGCISDPEPADIGVRVGDALPDFSVTLDTEEEITTASLQGKVTVIEFFNTKCNDCRNSFPVFQALFDHFQGNDKVTVFAISREENGNDIRDYWDTHNLTIPYSPQDNRKIYNLFATVGIPRIYIADKQGIITHIFSDTEVPDLSLLINSVEQNL